jgi:hypothetical protein
MKCVYEAANAVDAHMVANMLQAEGIATRIDGEHLPSGVGELPMAGLVRVMADETDLARARSVIRDWESELVSEPPLPPKKLSYAPLWFLAGILLSVAATETLRKSNVTQDGVDYNGDGTVDDHYTYASGYLSKIASDRNLDGKNDLLIEYDPQGIPTTSTSDENFDGRFEARTVFAQGKAQRVEVDMDGDGNIDIRQDYVDGVLATQTHYAPDGYHVKRRENYQAWLLVDAEADTDDDGLPDTRYLYDRYGNVRETVRL